MTQDHLPDWLTKPAFKIDADIDRDVDAALRRNAGNDIGGHRIFRDAMVANTSDEDLPTMASELGWTLDHARRERSEARSRLRAAACKLVVVT